jgi:hypothetical protein
LTLAEGWYQAPPNCTIATVGYRGTKTSLPAGWITPFRGTDTRDATGADVYTPTLDDTLRTVSLTTARRYVFT